METFERNFREDHSSQDFAENIHIEDLGGTVFDEIQLIPGRKRDSVKVFPDTNISLRYFVAGKCLHQLKAHHNWWSFSFDSGKGDW